MRFGIQARWACGCRDMMAGAQHATTGPLILRQCAKDLMGMAEGKVWGARAGGPGLARN